MKKYIFEILFSAAVILTSCSTKYLEDMKDYAGFSDAQVYSNESEASGLVDYIYNTIEPTTSAVPLQTLGDGTSYSSTFANSADEFGGSTVYVNNTTSILNSTVSTYFGTNMSNSLSNNTWTRIRQMNLFLDNLDKYGSSTISKASRDKFKGQMYFWRAWQYFDLVRLYGGVPLILHAQIVSSEDSTLQVPRSSTGQCIKQICADLDSAISLLPATWGTSDYGRIDKSAAAAFKARVLYTTACPIFNKDWDNPNSTKWDSAEKAHEAALAYLTANGKALEGESSPGTRGSAWAGIFKHSLYGGTRTVSPEAIIVYLYSSAISSGTSAYRANSWEYSIRPNWQGGSGALKPCAQIVDKFPMADGSLPVKGANYDTLCFFANRDPRFYRTFAFNGSFWPYADSTSSATVWAYNWKSSATGTTYYYSQAGTTVNAGVFIRKMSQDSKILKANYSYSTTDFIEFRYAEFLLNWALCYAAQNNLQKALDILARIRTRAGITAGANNYGLGFVGSYTKYSMLKAILYERSIELAFEGKRFWDMRNWQLLGDPLSTLAPNTNVCQALGITPQNGHRRTGFYLLSNTIGKGNNGDANDPLIKLRPNYNGATISAAGRLDPDATDAAWNAGMTSLQTFYKANFTRTMKDDLDGSGTTLFNYYFAPNYYFFGINSSVLSSNTYLNSQQTIGWNNLYGTAGTFDPTK